MKKDTVYISHMLDAIERINEYVSGLDLDDFMENRLIQAAVIRELEIIGEASKHISEETARIRSHGEGWRVCAIN